MNFKPLIIVLGEPYSVFPEIFFKLFKDFIKKRIKTPLIVIGSSALLLKQIKYFNYSFKLNIINEDQIYEVKNNKKINLININFKSRKIFDKNSKHSVDYIEKSFFTALKILKQKKSIGLINGPISKSKFLNKKFNGITEYLSHHTNSPNVAMIIFNKKLSVSPLTTHLPIKNVAKKISKKLIINKIFLINEFYRSVLKIKPQFALLGLNPHCESNAKFSEEEKILKPAIKLLKKKKIRISGPFPADTFFLKTNYKKYDLVIGMYHDQVLTPIKTIFGFDAINLTLGLPFIRVSPDHGPNEYMVSKGKSDALSLKRSFIFFEELNENKA